MLDVNVIRQNPEMIRTMLRNRNKDEAILDRFLEADAEWRALTDENNRLRKVRNEVSMSISKMKGEEKDAKIAEMREVADKIKSNDDRMAELEEIRTDCVLNIPNIPHESVPIGKDDTENVVVYEAGEKRKFDFKPKEHWQIAEDLDIIEFERGIKVAGSGFYVMKGDGARLERALINYFLDMHQDQGYTELVVPGIINKNAVIGTGQYRWTVQPSSMPTGAAITSFPPTGSRSTTLSSSSTPIFFFRSGRRTDDDMSPRTAASIFPEIRSSTSSSGSV